MDQELDNNISRIGVRPDNHFFHHDPHHFKQHSTNLNLTKSFFSKKKIEKFKRCLQMSLLKCNSGIGVFVLTYDVKEI